jgi:hypothetical protein
MSALTVGLACEDQGHFLAVTCLVDAALLARYDWLEGILEDCRSWRGLSKDERWYKFDPADAYDLRPFTSGGRRIAPLGHIGGQPLKPEAAMGRKVLLMFCHREPRPDVVILARDMDGYRDRLAGLKQVRDGLPWPFRVAIALAEPEIEAWHVCGFVPRDDEERGQLRELKEELSFDPTVEPHRLTSRPNDAPTDAKRVLSRLCQEDEEREIACLADHELLRGRGTKNGLTTFLDDVDRHIVPAFGAPAGSRPATG